MCAPSLVEGDFYIRNEIKTNFFWWRYLFKANKYTWLGGTFIDKDSSFKTVLSMLFEFTLVRLLGKELHFRSVGFSVNVPFYKRLAQSYIIFISSSVSARDQESYLFAKRSSSSVSLGKDIVVENHSSIFTEKECEVISGQCFWAVDKKKSLDVFRKHEKSISPHMYSWVTVPLSTYKKKEQSLVLAEASKSLLPNVNVVDSEYAVDNVLNVIGQSEVVVTDRLHVAISALFMKKKVYLLAVSEKLLNTKGLVSQELAANLFVLS